MPKSHWRQHFTIFPNCLFHFFEDNFFIQPENFELLGNFHRIGDNKLKDDVQNLLKTMAQQFS